MKIKPMLGSFALEGIERIESLERRALVEHRVPGLAGNYFQDLGTTANLIVVAGTRHGDEARDAFLNGIREIFNRGEQTTFVADINTATDITEVVIEDLNVAEFGGPADSFRYVVRLRKYVPPPEPPAATLLDLEAGILDDAAGLLDAVNTLDALASIPNLGDPTPPLRESLAGVTAATSELPPTVESISGLLGPETGGPLDSLPAPEEFSNIMSTVIGERAGGTGVAGAVGILNDAGVSAQATAMASQLQTALGATLSGGESPPTAGVLDQFATAAQALPSDPAALTAPLTSRLDVFRRMTSPEVSGGLLSGITALRNLPSLEQSQPTALLQAARLDALGAELLSGESGRLRQWSEATSLLTGELAALVAGDVAAAKDRLIAFLGDQAADLANLVLPGARGPADGFATRLDAAVSQQRIDAVQAAKEALLADLDRTRGEFAGGDFTNTAALSAAEADFDRLVRELEGLAGEIDAALGDPGATAPRLVEALARHYDGFQSLAVVDLTDLRRQAQAGIAALGEAIRAINLEGARSQLEAAWAQISGVVTQLDVERVAAALEEAQGPIREALASLDAALFEIISLIRSAFDRLREALRSVMNALGTTRDDGGFQFHAQREIETFLTHLKSELNDTAKPLLDSFKNTVTQVMDRVTGALSQVREQIEAVKAQLQQALNAALEQLRALDIRGTMERVRQTLENMVSQLGAIDFDVVVDPVVAQINDMRDQLRRIDTASLNEVIRTALRTAVQVVTSIDFTTQISNALKDEFDAVLEVPGRAAGDLQARVDGALGRLSALTPEAAVAPLADLFAPLTGALDTLRVDALAAPLGQWHRAARAELDKVMPSALLEPVVAAYDDLTRTFASLTTASLIGTLEGALAQVRSEVQRLEPSRLTGDLSSAISAATSVVQGLAPDRVFAPLTAEFDRLTQALAGFDPATLFAPMGELFDRLTAPLDALTDDDAGSLGELFAPLTGLPDALDPRRNFETASARTAAARRLLEQVSIGRLIAEIKPGYDAAFATLQASGGAGTGLTGRVQALNPLQHQAIARLAERFQAAQTMLQSAFPEAAPPEDLAARFTELRPRLEALTPAWARPTPTAAGIRQAMEWANPASLGADLGTAYEALMTQWRALDPRAIGEGLGDAHRRLVEALAALEPAALTGRLQGLVQDLLDRLGGLSLQTLAGEAGDLESELRGLLVALDPRPVIQQLDALASEIKALFNELDPAALLSSLQEPLEAVKAVVQEFDPASFAQVLQPVSAEVQDLLAQIDIGPVLEPITSRLQALRTELEQALRRTESAFDEMIAAIPL